ncbi:MAG TPA: hypothetical protein VGO13_00285 [Solirubrobacterales bacterium]|jgi:hypothetical protein|nr:hypothetical protein [Solirubrobacterales bacterium]
MRLSTFPLAVLIATAALTAPAAAVAAKAQPGAKGAYRAYASCDDAAPFHAARRCGYDKPRLFRATFVFQSNVGKLALKACFRVYGAAPLGGGHACAKLKPTAHKDYPFKISGVRQPFTVKVTWFTKMPGAGGRFKLAAGSFLRVHA